jgi:hypothetical protein
LSPNVPPLGLQKQPECCREHVLFTSDLFHKKGRFVHDRALVKFLKVWDVED